MIEVEPPSPSRRPFNPSDDAFDLPPIETGQARHESNQRNWVNLFEGINAFDAPTEQPAETTEADLFEQSNSVTFGSSMNTDTPAANAPGKKEPYQLHNTYIVSQIKSGFMLLDQQATHERILYERYQRALQDHNLPVQQLLFPKTLAFTPADAEILSTMLDDINRLGFDLQTFGGNTFVLHGVPAQTADTQDEQVLIDTLLAQYKDNLDLRLDIKDKIAAAMARSMAIKKGYRLGTIEMQELIDQLFACDNPYKSPTGRNCFITFELDDLVRKFQN
jgi:DNA mismatch repair protein MutL